MVKVNNRTPVNRLSSEEIVLRLFRYMGEVEQQEFIESALMILARQYGLDEGLVLAPPDDIQWQLTEGLDELLMFYWPGDWPGRQIVDLDCLGDPGAWLSRVIAEPVAYVLFGSAEDIESPASYLAQDYLFEIREQGYPLPSDFGDDPVPSDCWTDEDEEQVRTEFIAFLEYWGERVLATLEKQSQRTKQE